MKKVLVWLLALSLVFGSAGVASAKGFSSRGSHSYSSSTGTSQSGNRPYSSGQKSPSSSVTKNPSTSTNSSQQPRRSLFGGGVGSFFGGMIAGSLIGSLFHPFGMNGFGSGFSIFGFLFDILIVFVVYKVVRRIFFKR